MLDSEHSEWRKSLIRPSRFAWLLPITILVGAYLGRASLGPNAPFLDVLNVTMASILVLTIRGLPRRSAWLWAATLVLISGGFLQLFWLSYQLKIDPAYIPTNLPDIAWLSPSDIYGAYLELTALFSVFVVVAALLVHFGPSPRFDLNPQHVGPAFKRWIAGGTAVYAAATLLQIALGFGLYGTATATLPFHSNTIISFYRQELFPSMLLLGVWVFDKGSTRWRHACIFGLGGVAAVEAYVSTSRGTLITYGVPLLFLWFILGRFTKSRKVLVVLGLVAYLLFTPVLSAIRLDRLSSAHVISGVVRPEDYALAQSLDRSLIRVGGAEGILVARHYGQQLGFAGVVDALSPNTLILYYTYNVIGLPKDTPLADFRAPAALGVAVLVGGDVGAVGMWLVLLALFAAGWSWILRCGMSWPVGCALFCGAIASYFSEGGVVIIYKYALAFLAVELLYRHLRPRPPEPQTSDSGGANTGQSARLSSR
jgi:hypothetical protein